MQPVAGSWQTKTDSLKSGVPSQALGAGVGWVMRVKAIFRKHHMASELPTMVIF
jgi:hypothetical protein